MNVIPSILTEEERTILCTRQDALDAYNRLPTHGGQVYFQMTVPESVKQSLSDRFGLNLSTVQRLPFRWIRGDTVAHVDRGQSDFENTYLVYLTDGEGEFHIGDETYPIEAGTGFSFSEGLRHEVVGTHGSSRLLLGPMSEQGFPVGAPVEIQADGATEIVYFREDSGNIEYSLDNSTWNSATFPYTIRNTNLDPTNNILKVYFTTNMTFTDNNQYFTPASDGVQFGNTSLNTDGTRPEITIQDAVDYRGLVKNGGPGLAAQSYVYVVNIVIVAAGTSSLIAEGGWIAQSYFANANSNIRIVNCAQSGLTIPQGCGGIVGAYAAYDGGTLYIVGCASSASMDTGSGGIVGSNAGDTNGTVNINSCMSVGSIGDGAGGIVGSDSGSFGGNVTVDTCYSLGTIGLDAGGIIGVDGNATVLNCFSFGSTIGAQGGGIFGSGASISSTASNCYTGGSIGNDAGGIFGKGGPVGNATNCYSFGSTGGGTGTGIYALSASEAPNNYAEANHANAGFNLTNAVATLIGATTTVGSVWSFLAGPNILILTNFGYSPYTFDVVVTPGYTLQRTSSQTVSPGGSTIAGIPAGLSYTYLATTPSDPGTITIDGTTGVVSASSTTPVGTYTVYLISSLGGSFLSVSTLVLTVSGPGGGVSSIFPIGFKRLNYEQYLDLRFGNRLVLERLTDMNVRFISYADYMKYRIARATISTK